MTPSKHIKARYPGLTTTKVVDALGYKPDGNPVVSAQTLANWFDDKRSLFDCVVTGVAVRLGIDDNHFGRKE